jgi:hypothetical protein
MSRTVNRPALTIDTSTDRPRGLHARRRAIRRAHTRQAVVAAALAGRI